MPSGYEQSDDYGGPPPTWRGTIILTVAVALLLLAGLYALGADRP